MSRTHCTHIIYANEECHVNEDVHGCFSHLSFTPPSRSMRFCYLTVFVAVDPVYWLCVYFAHSGTV